jgi:hypothetical protein
MPVIVNKENVEYYLVPAPLVSFSKQNYNNIGRPGFGADYSVTLQGTLIQTHGNPYYATGVAGLADDGTPWTTTRDVEPEEITAVSGADLLDATIRKQELIRHLFTNPSISGVAKPLKVTIKGWEDGTGTGSGLSFQAFVDDITFDADSAWARPTTYTISMRNATFLQSANDSFSEYANENLASGGYAISSLTENFDIQEDGRSTIKFVKNGYISQAQSLLKVYTVNRSVTAVGSPVYDDTGGYLSGLAPWQQASGYIFEYMGLETGVIPSSLLASNFLTSGYNIANTVYQESIDREAGSYSLTETYIAYSGEHPVLEQITINNDIGENESNSVSVQATIQGLNTSNGFASSGNAYLSANTYWTGVVGTGVPPEAYYYAKGVLSNEDWLHPKPLNRSVARDFSAGTISYTYNFDDRPPNLIPGSISESIQVSDTYPGEIFSVTPVIGRSQPVLQYLNSRSEYKRSLSINVTMGKPTGYAWGTEPGANVDISGRITGNHDNILKSLMLQQKPSISNNIELNYIYQAANPVNDPYFTVSNGKCFHSAPTESWDAKTRNYTYNIEWTYERA